MKLRGFGNASGVANSPKILKDKKRILYTAIVIDFISNPEEYLQLEGSSSPVIKEDQDTSGKIVDVLKKSLSNGIIAEKIPRNTIIAQVISDKGSRSKDPEFIYPFFSPHFCMPVKSGEQIWVIYEGLQPGSPGYWICRKPSDLQVDDLNYTHQDRVSLNLGLSSQDSSAFSSHEGESESDPDPFSFPLGGSGNVKNNTLVGPDPYTDIIKKSLSYKDQFVGEPVLRFSKRAADLVFQGSNNTLISLGQDRQTESDPSSIDSTPEKKSNASVETGTIDIVAGRGQAATTSAVDVGEAVDRDYDEIDKAPGIAGNNSNLHEGDPDFINDLSRVYVSMKTDGDSNFDIDIDSIGSADNSEADVDQREQEPFVIIKSTNPRIIAREDGSIKIIHESGSSIVMDSEGAIQIKGDSVVIGNSNSNQPYIRYDEFKTLMKNVISDINGLASDINNIQIGMTAAGSAGTSGPIYGPLMGFGAISSVASTFNINASSIPSATSGTKVGGTDISTVKSSVISGE